MEKITTSQAHSTAPVSPTSSAKIHQHAKSFANLLNSHLGATGIQQNEALTSQQVMQTRANTAAESLHNKPPDSSAPLVSLGVLNGKAPTVSHLLKAHSTLQGETWNILSSSANRGKVFTGIPVGTLVQLDPVTKEISFRHPSQIRPGNESAPSPATSIAGQKWLSSFGQFFLFFKWSLCCF